MQLKIFIGWETRETTAWRVLEHSIRRHASLGVQIQPIILGEMQYRGLYNRPMSMRNGLMFDDISNAPMSTEFAISRFLTPYLAGYSGWALFCDPDMLACTDLTRLIRGVGAVEPGKPVYCVKHKQEAHGEAKMDGQKQVPYPRKNWSSFMLFDCDHSLNKNLTPSMVNSLPGRDLHAFCWLPGYDGQDNRVSDEANIGELPLGWNWLEGYSNPHHAPINVIHYTRGGPWLPDYSNVAYADLWHRERQMMDGTPMPPRMREAAE
jgi:hypothetical protein